MHGKQRKEKNSTLCCVIHFMMCAAGPVETTFGTHLIYVESCNKPQNTWKMMFDDVVGKMSGKGEEEKK